MIINELINNNKEDFYQLCSEHSVKYLYAFGSSVSGGFDFEKSDIDLMVEIEEPDPITKGEKIMSLWDKLEAFFKRKVDLLTNLSIRNRILLESIETTKVLIYEKS
ncbi:MAG TPA: nucleotidyltransferase domain-containing protein [Prolixibacteraceae bacterium]|nr:nucleotidyltransferase domain-containing protein [Prolixibacteraceae bacterium]